MNYAKPKKDDASRPGSRQGFINLWNITNALDTLTGADFFTQLYLLLKLSKYKI